MMTKVGYCVVAVLRVLLIAGVLAPSLVVNILPKLSIALAGHADGNTIGMMLLFAISVPLLAGGVIAYGKSKDFGNKAVIAIVCSFLALINAGNAIDVASHVKDAYIDPRRD